MSKDIVVHIHSDKVLVRNSFIELLRILCIFGIVNMHAFGIYFSTVSGWNLIYGVVINSFFNCGVSIFTLISGYYGIKSSGKKLVGIWIEILF